MTPRSLGKLFSEPKKETSGHLTSAQTASSLDKIYRDFPDIRINMLIFTVRLFFFYFDDRSVEYIFELYHMKWGLYDNKLIADCNKYELGIFIPDAGIQTHDQ